MANSSFFKNTGTTSQLQTSAQQYADDAEKLAINPEDSQYTLSDGTTTGYSALHHSAKAEDSKNAAATSATSSATSATASSNSAAASASSATAAAASQTAAASSASSASSDATQTAADRVQTGLDAIATAADRVQTGLDATATAADAVSTAADRVQTGLDAASASSDASAASSSAAAALVSQNAASASQTAAAASASSASADAASTAADATATAADAVATAADRVQTGLDRTAAANSASAASTSATAAAASQVAAASSAASAAAVFNDFEDRYYGPHASDSAAATYITGQGLTVDQGDLYFNSTANEMRVYDGGSWIAASSAGGASLINYNYTATASQTAFTGSDDNSNTLSYTVDNLIVTRNGVVLEDGTDYTATDGSTVTLAVAASAGDEINIVAFKSFTTADMVSATNGGTFQGNVDFSAGIDVTGNITVTGTVDGRDVATDGTKLDGIEALADVTDATNVAAAGAAMLTGANFTGNVDVTGDLTVDTNTLYVDSTNNRVGVGTASPTYQLQLSSDDPRIAMTDTTHGTWFTSVGYGGGNDYSINQSGVGTRLLVDSSGNVGIGDNSPTQKLSVAGHIKVDAGFTGYLQGPTGEMLVGEDGSGFYVGTGFGVNPTIPFYYGNTGYTTSHNFRGGDFNVTTTNVTYTLPSNSSNVRFNNGLTCIYGSDFGSQLSIWADGSGPTHLAGYTFDIQTGSNGNRTNRGFYQDSTGTITIGKSSGGPSGYTTAMNLRYVGGGAEYGIDFQPAVDGANAATFWSAAGSVSGAINVGASSTLYNTSSDYRLKTAVTYDWDATSRLKQLKPARFKWIVDGDDAVPVDGFLAHEVEDIVPESITGTKDAMRDEEYEVTPAVEATYDDEGNVLTEYVPPVMGKRSVPDYQGIDQSKLVPLLVKTIQELEARIAALENA